MNKNVSAVGFDFEEKQTEMIDKKLERIRYAEDLIIDLIVKVKHEKAYKFDINVNFRWGEQAHVAADDFDFGAALNKVMDVLDTKIKKAKDKVQEK